MLNEFELKNLIAKGANNHIYFLFGDDPYLVKTYADKIIKEDLSVRQTEKLVSDLLNSKPKKEENKKNTSYKNVEKQLSDIFKTKVKISSGKNKGKIEFEFYNKDDFERLLFELKK